MKLAAFLIAEGDRQAARVGHDGTDLPSADDLVDDAGQVASDQVIPPEGQLIAPVGHNLLLALEVVTALAAVCSMWHSPREVDRALPGVVRIERKSPGQLLCHTELKCIEVGVLVVAVVLNARIPAAGTRGARTTRKSTGCA